MPCPKCQHELRVVNSLGINLCDQCGYREDLPIVAVPKKKRVNYLPLLVMIGVGGLAIAAMVGTTAYKIAEERAFQKELARLKQESEEAARETAEFIKKNQGTDMSTLPAICQPGEYQKLDYEMYLNCFPEGMTYSQVNQITGKPGEIVSSSGDTKVMQFIGRGDYSGYGYMAIVFQNNQIVSKSQTNLIRH